MNLESQPTKTPEQEAELARKKAELAELERKLQELEAEKQREQEKKPTKDSNLGLKVGTGIGVAIIFGVLGMIVAKRKKSKKY